MPETAPEQAQTTVGKPIDRVDGRLKVTGRAQYAADFKVPEVAFAVGFQSTIASGRVKSIDVSQASKLPGVLSIITHENAPKLHRVSMDHQTGKPGQTWFPLENPEVRYAGQYLGVVVAETITQAMHACGLVKVEYETGKPSVQMADQMGAAFGPKKMGRSDKPQYKRGDAAGALAAAALKVDNRYTTPVENHNPMELSSTIAMWEGDRLTLYDSTQWVYGVRSVIATWLGMPDENVRVIDPYLGGGFGCKGSIWPHEVIAAIAAKQVNRPVKMVVTRAQMFSCVGYRPQTIQRVALGADKDGKLTSIIHDCASQTCVWKDEWVETATKQTRMLYACDNVETTQLLVPINANTPTQMRAPGHATGTFALEVAMDELAYAAKVDPVELRLRNYAEKDGEENKAFSSKALKECYQQGGEKFGWSKRNPQPGSMKNGRYLVGWGMATATYPTNRQESNARVRINTDGRAIVSVASHDLGTGTYTVLSQIAADTLGLPLSQVQVELGDSTLPQAPVSGGSQTLASVGPAVKIVCMKAVAALKERAAANPASPLSGQQAKAIGSANGRLFLNDNPSTGETFRTILQRDGGRAIDERAVASLPGEAAATEDAAQSAKPQEEYSKHSWGAQFVEVQIDPILRTMRVSRMVGAFAAGRIFNAKTARSQLIGGMVWGIGAALFEQTVYDPRTAKIVNDSLENYLVPVNLDIPPLECIFVEEKDPHVNPLGAKGIGELGITGVAAAIANAVYHATGKRLRELPITLDQLL